MRGVKLSILALVLAGTAAAQEIATANGWVLSRVPDEKYGAGYGCEMRTRTPKGAEARFTVYFLGADVAITGPKAAFPPHTGTLVLYFPDLGQQLTVSGASFGPDGIRARAGEQTIMAMFEAVAAAGSPEFQIGEGDDLYGIFRIGAVADVMPQLRDCFAGL